MKLTFQQIQTITVGAARIWEEANGIHFAKLTKAQQDALDTNHPRFASNGVATTGVRLDFCTDSPFFSYTTLTNGKYELKVDGLLTDCITAKAGEAVTYTFSDTLPSHRVTLHLPSHGQGGGFAEVTLADGSTFERHKFDRKFLFIGDSITQGWNSELDTLSYAYQVCDHFNAESIIQGVGGACYDEATLDSIPFDPDTVFVAYGTNDISSVPTIEEIEANCSAFLQKLRRLFPAPRICVITPPWSHKENHPYPAGKLADARATIASVAKRLALDVIDGKTMIPPLATMMADAVHPNDIGFACYAHNLIKALSK